LYGPTGSGKSRAIIPFRRLLAKALPDRDSEEEEPTGVTKISTPGSSEALIDALVGNVMDGTGKLDHISPVSALLDIDEFAAFVKKASTPGSGLKERIIELYDLFDDNIEQVTRTHGKVVAVQPYFQVVTTTQPKHIADFLRRTDTESGLLNRFIFAPGKPRRAPISYGKIRIDIDEAARILETIFKFAQLGHEYVLEGDALAYWDKFFQDNIAPMKLGVVDSDSMVARIDLILKKLIILFAINSMEHQPSVESVQRACSLFHYLMTSYQGFGTDISHTENRACEEKIINVLTGWSQSKAPTRRDLTKRVGKQFESEVIEKTLKTMVALGMIEEVPDKQDRRGRPTTRYSVAN
jgi:hypothetical protein